MKPPSTLPPTPVSFPQSRVPWFPLAGEELAVDKVLAIFGRAEGRDFIDLSAVEGRYGIENLCALAADKDPGFTPTMFAGMLSRFDRLGRQEFEIDDDQFAQLGSAVQVWRDGRSSWHDLGDETGASAEIKGMTPDWGSEGQPRPDWYTSGHTTSAIPQWHCESPNPKEVAARAGHSSVSFTLDRYGHLLPGSEQRLNDALDDLAQEARTADCLPENGPSDTELPDSTAHADGTQIRRRRHATL